MGHQARKEKSDRFTVLASKVAEDKIGISLLDIYNTLWLSGGSLCCILLITMYWEEKLPEINKGQVLILITPITILFNYYKIIFVADIIDYAAAALLWTIGLLGIYFSRNKKVPPKEYIALWELFLTSLMLCITFPWTMGN